MPLCTCRTSGDKEAQTPQSFLPQPHKCFAEGSPVTGGLKILNRLAQVPGSAVLRFALLVAGTQIHCFFHQGNQFISGPGLAAVFQPNVFISLPSAGLTSCIQGSQSFPSLIKGC